MIVRFIHKVPPYCAGEQAAFPDREARRFIGLGAAREVPALEDIPANENKEYRTTSMPAAPANRMVFAASKKGRKR